MSDNQFRLISQRLEALSHLVVTLQQELNLLKVDFAKVERFEPNPMAQTHKVASPTTVSTHSIGNPSVATVKQNKKSLPTEEKVSSQQSTTKPDAVQSNDWELKLGTRWFSRLGIITLLVGLALAFTYAFPSFGKELKILSGVVLSAFLFGLGNHFRPKFSILAHVLQGGGISLGYLTLFAMFFIPVTQCWNLPMVGIGCLVFYHIVTAWVAHRQKSQTIAILTLAYGYFTASYSGEITVAFMTASLLSVTSVILTGLNPSWRVLNKVTFFEAFVTVMYWHSHQGNNPMTQLEQWYAWGQYLLFAIASIFVFSPADKILLGFASIWFYTTYSILGLPCGQIAGTFEVVLALLHFGFWWAYKQFVPKGQANEVCQSILLCLALSFVGLATLRYFNGSSKTLVFALESLVLTLVNRREPSKLYKVFAYIFWGLGAVSQLWLDVVSHEPRAVIRIVPMWGLTSVAIVFSLFDRAQKPSEMNYVLLCVALFGLWLASNALLPLEWVTLSYVLTGFALLLLGFFSLDKVFRRLGIIWLVLAIARVFFFDIATLGILYKIVLFMTLGLALLGVSYAYTRMEASKNSKEPSEEPLK